MAATVAATGALAALWLGKAASCAACDILNIAPSLWLVLGLVACAGMLAMNRRRWIVPVGLAIAIAIAGLRDSMPVASPCPNGQPAALKIVSFNLFGGNRTPQAAAKWIIGQDPDAVILVEAKGRSAAVPDLLRSEYPYQVNCHPRGICSTFILTRVRPVFSRPLARGDVENRQSLSAALVRIPTRDGPAAILAVHFSRPWPIGRQQREALKLRADMLGLGSPDDLIVAGDFNASEQMKWPNDLATDLQLARLATGPTWPMLARPLPAFVALDHIMVGSRWQGSAHVGPSLGSDHRPLVAEICIRRDANR